MQRWHAAASVVEPCLVACVCVQVRCVHPRHPNPHKQYAMKLVVNYWALSQSRDIARRYGLDCHVLQKLPQRHPNLCKLLAEFTSAVPDEMFDHLTPVRRVTACCYSGCVSTQWFVCCVFRYGRTIGSAS